MSLPSSTLSYDIVHDSQLSPSEFLDRAILLLAARHGAKTDFDHQTVTTGDDVDQDQQQMMMRWLEVSRDIQALSKSHSCRNGQLRVVSRMVDDAEAFSPQSCINRAKFAMYRLEKEQQQRDEEARKKKQEERQQKQQQRQQQQQYASAASTTTTMAATRALQNQYVDPRDPKPSGFDITKGHSIADAVNRIMEECRAKIMNITISSSSSSSKIKRIQNGQASDELESDSDSDDDDNSPIEIYKPPEHIARSLMMTEEDTRRAMELGHAEEDLINRVHNMQMEHYKKYKKWVNLVGGDSSSSSGDTEMVPASLLAALSDVSPSTKAALLQDSSSRKSANASGDDSAAVVVLNKLSADDVAEMLGKLNLGEHIGRFRRTSGPLLAQMTKDDIRLRFDGDHEATDILWMHLEEKTVRENNNKKSSRLFNNQQGDEDDNEHDEQQGRSSIRPSSSKSESSSLLPLPSSSSAGASAARPRLGAGITSKSGSSRLSKESSQMKAIYDAISAPSADLAMSQQELDDFENLGGGSRGGASDLREQLRQGNFHALKRTLDILEGNGGGVGADDGDDEDSESTARRSDKNNNNYYSSSSASSSQRPLRPSQEYKLMRDHHQHHDDYHRNKNNNDLNELTESYMNTLGRGGNGNNNNNNNNNNVSSSSSKSSQQDVAAVRGGRGGGAISGGRGGGSSSVVSSSSKPATMMNTSTATTTTAAPSSRGGRWAIVEYDDEDDDDNVE